MIPRQGEHGGTAIRRLIPLLALGMSACVSRPEPPMAVAPLAPVPVETPAPILPPVVAARPSPNQGLSAAAAVWHLRTGLNVAALVCRDATEAETVARYNAWLARDRAALDQARLALEREYEAGGGDWRDRYDDAMTRLYNYWSQPAARVGFCAAAQGVLAELEATPPESLPDFAPVRLALLDRTFGAPAPVMAVADPPRLAVDPAVFRLP